MKLPWWADWIQFGIVVGGLVAVVAVFVYRRYGQLGTIALKDVTTDLSTGDYWIQFRADLRRSVSFVKVRLVFSDSRWGERTANRGDRRITEVSDGTSPSSINENDVRLSYALSEIRFRDMPLLAGPDDPIYLQIRYKTSKPWSGLLVFIGYDEDGHRLSASCANFD